MIEIRDWNKHYENHESRKLKNLTWIALPTKLTGNGVCTIVKQPDGVEIFGCFILLLELASKSTPRGIIKHDNETISRLTGVCVGTIIKTVEMLSNPPLDWLISRQSPDDLPAISRQSPGNLPHTGKGTTGKGTTGVIKNNNTLCQNSDVVLTDVVEIYEYYLHNVHPVQPNRQTSLNYIKRIITTHGHSKELVISTIDAYIESFNDNQRDNPQFRSRPQNFFSPVNPKYTQFLEPAAESTEKIVYGIGV